MGITGYPVHDVAGIGAHCDLALVVGGDGTMLGIGRKLAHLGVPLIGINDSGGAYQPRKGHRNAATRLDKPNTYNKP